jgi:DNA-binding beta-propeller fold protein YncE
MIKKITKNEGIKIDFPCECLTRMTYSEKSKRILICDSKEAKIKVLNADTYELEFDINPWGMLIHPVSICTDDNYSSFYVYVGDYKTQSVLVFNKKLAFIREIGENIEPFYIQYDNEENILYVCDKKTSKISLFNILYGQLLRCITSIQYPGYFKIIKGLLYVICGNKDSIESVSLNEKNYCLKIVNKTTGQIVDSFDLNRYLGLRGLFVFDNSVFTTAYKHEYEQTRVAHRVNESLSSRMLISINTTSTINTNKKEINGRVNDGLVYVGKKPNFTESNFINYSMEGNYLIPENTSDLLVVGNRLLICQSDTQKMAFQVLDLHF